MSDPHNIIPGHFFTREQWEGQLAPFVERLVERPGGVLLISVTVKPATQNYPDVGFCVLDAEERVELKKRMATFKKHREAKV